MKKIVDDPRLIFKCCSLYYEDQMGQQEISTYLGISRATVSRMLQKGRQSGIVKIQVVNPAEFSYGKLEKMLEQKYGLKEVVVIESSPLDTKLDATTRLSEEAASFLDGFFSEGDYIGVSMGFTLHNISKIKRVFDTNHDYMFVPIVGGVSRGTIDKVDVQSNQIAKEFAYKFGGNYTQFLAPAVFSEREVMQGFLQEKSINYIFDDFQKISTVVMGIGIPERGGNTLISAGYLTPKEVEQFVENGAVGDISLRFYDSTGNADAFERYNSRVAGISLTFLKEIKNRIAIVGGAERANAVKGAINGGYINILITDNDCAEALL